MEVVRKEEVKQKAMDGYGWIAVGLHTGKGDQV